MTESISRFRRPSLEEQHVLDRLEVRLLCAEEQDRFESMVSEHHYLHSAGAVGEQMRYVVTFEGEWLGLALWAAPALHLRARDSFIGWSDEQRRKRLGLVANNTRLLILPQCHYPNLIEPIHENDAWALE